MPTPHPHQSTVDLLRRMVARLPPKFPRALGRYMIERAETLARDAGIPAEELARSIAEFGVYLWHYRKAFEEAFAREGIPRWEERFLAELPGALRTRVVGDASGRSLEIMRAPAFESAYSPEDKLVIEEALLTARRAVEEELRDRVDRGEVADYDHRVLAWKHVRLDMEEALLSLRELATAKPAWAREILDKLRTYEEGIAGIGPEPTREELRKEVESYRNVA